MQETVRIANKENAELRIGYLKCYGGQEFQLAVAEFSEKYPDVSVHIINGNHEELYDALRNGGVDLSLSDQRRAFSDEYVNMILAASQCYIEIAARNPLASLESVGTEELKNTPCILIASSEQQENERTYYQEFDEVVNQDDLDDKTRFMAILAAQLYGEFKEMFPENAVEYFVSYYGQ